VGHVGGIWGVPDLASGRPTKCSKELMSGVGRGVVLAGSLNQVAPNTKAGQPGCRPGVGGGVRPTMWHAASQHAGAVARHRSLEPSEIAGTTVFKGRGRLPS
jgi:hypothetical protein